MSRSITPGSQDIFNDLLAFSLSEKKHDTVFFNRFIQYLASAEPDNLLHMIDFDFKKFLKEMENKDNYKGARIVLWRYLWEFNMYIKTSKIPEQYCEIFKSQYDADLYLDSKDGMDMGDVQLYASAMPEGVICRVRSFTEATCKELSKRVSDGIFSDFPSNQPGQTILFDTNARSFFEQALYTAVRTSMDHNVPAKKEKKLTRFEKIKDHWSLLSNKNKAVFFGVLTLQVALIITLAVILPGSPLLTVAGSAFLSLKLLGGMAAGVSFVTQLTYGFSRLFKKRPVAITKDQPCPQKSLSNSASGTGL